MSQKRIPTPSNFEHSRQPIHFYATNRNSMHDLYHPNSMSQITSSNKYFSSRMSPIKPHSSTNITRSPQTQFQVDRVMNSSYLSKYAKFTTKIQMLQKNLNRLNGQHQSLMSMFQRSEQLIGVKYVFEKIDKLKERLQESRGIKHIEQKRYEARHEVVYDDLIKQFGEVEKTQVHDQKKKIAQLEEQNKKLQENTSKMNIYDTIYTYSSSKIEDLKENTQRYINEITNSLRNETLELLKKCKFQEKIKQREQKLSQKIEKIMMKLGELKCLTQYEMFLAKENNLSVQISKLKGEFENGKYKTEEEKAEKMNELQLKFIEYEMKFLTIESADRLTFHLANIDSKFVKVIQKYEAKIHKSQKHKHKLNSNANAKLLSFNTKNQSNTSQEVFMIETQLAKLNHELNGLKRYLARSNDKVTKLESFVSEKVVHDKKTSKDEFEDFLQDFEEKIKLLNKNVNFFKQTCAKQLPFSS